ncbi:MAG: hypothetical protein GEV03_28290 [Streptosporangiales bacterium]|nr:hypothetical protein [Streptosporangiales bacterium]
MRQGGSVAKRVLSLCILGAVMAAAGACAEEESENPDPRAYPRSDPDVGLNVALSEHKIVLPKDARGLRFKVTTPMDYELDLTFRTKCGNIASFLQESNFRKRLKDGYAPSIIVGNAVHYGWELGPKERYAGLAEKKSSPQRYVVVSHRNKKTCQIFLYSNYS